MLSDYEHLVQAEEIYDAKLNEIDDAIKHSSVYKLEYCEFKLCSLFKIYVTLMRNVLSRVIPVSFRYSVQRSFVI